MNVTLTVNGQNVSRDVEPRMLLAEFLRDDLHLTGTHVGCDTTQCGCCIVHVDGQAVKSCTMFAVQADGATVVTIEGLAQADGALHPVQAAGVESHRLGDVQDGGSACAAVGGFVEPQPCLGVSLTPLKVGALRNGLHFRCAHG